jgi:hypothetical protein
MPTEIPPAWAEKALRNENCGPIVKELGTKPANSVARTIVTLPTAKMGCGVGVVVGDRVKPVGVGGAGVGGAGVGYAVGVTVGSTVGVTVEIAVGTAVGAAVGAPVGATVGVDVESAVGASVGLAVGADVGIGIGSAGVGAGGDGEA